MGDGGINELKITIKLAYALTKEMEMATAKSPQESLAALH